MKRKLRILLWALVALWMGVIFYFSAQDAQTSGAQSGNLIRLFLGWLDPLFDSLSAEQQEVRVEFFQTVVRKLTHMSIYAVLGALCVSALMTHTMKTTHRPLVAGLICVLYAASDEFHQTFVPGRSGELRDLLIDSGGAILGILFIIGIVWLFQKKRVKAG